MVLNLRRTREGEREIKLLPQNHSPEVDYSLFIMVMMVEMLGKIEISLAVAPAEFPPPIFDGSSSVLVFQCFCGALSRDA